MDPLAALPGRDLYGPLGGVRNCNVLLSMVWPHFFLQGAPSRAGWGTASQGGAVPVFPHHHHCPHPGKGFEAWG